ncbi:166L [Invertebrate iridescent virus Kaz2018]|uniref:166L n=1 Tax=Invertebrate iridescent virus 6 TaxID=176652 RepID=Q91FZ3_IIV6|nr:166L [Invertebrate iridescent virus 6]AAK82039.1 166L [Invertebrate iridescent virus 6]QMS79586.1 hypothetical protein IIV6-T1_166 [Invertebrate iridescent virus 6]QNH08576.1 166L [Invertebrate iridescent virus Kaz2018]
MNNSSHTSRRKKCMSQYSPFSIKIPTIIVFTFNKRDFNICIFIIIFFFKC